MWWSRWPSVGNALLQNVHWWHLWLVCICISMLRISDWLNASLQCTLVWSFTCIGIYWHVDIVVFVSVYYLMYMKKPFKSKLLYYTKIRSEMGEQYSSRPMMPCSPHHQWVISWKLLYSAKVTINSWVPVQCSIVMFDAISIWRSVVSMQNAVNFLSHLCSMLIQQQFLGSVYAVLDLCTNYFRYYRSVCFQKKIRFSCFKTVLIFI